MKNRNLVFMTLMVVISLIGCSGKGGDGASVTGKASFVLGGSSFVRSPQRGRSGVRLNPGDGYLISPNQAKITFTSIVFRDANGGTLGTSTLTNCVVTYDRSKISGTSLLDCPFAVPVGAIAQISVGFSNTIQLLVNDTLTGIYTDSASTTGFTTTSPGGGPDFVNFLVTAGANASERSTPIIFPAPITVAAGSTPQLFITTDMIHGLQLTVDGSGNSLSAPAVGTEDPVALFGGFTKGTSMYYSGASTIESIKVQGTPSLRVFTDADGKPLYLIGTTCGVDGPKGAWATPPIGATIGGWLGKDPTNTLAWALPTDSTYTTYSAYFVMAEQTTIGASTTLYCKATASPPPPTDGKTYASGAPAIPSPTTSTVLNLLAK